MAKGHSKKEPPFPPKRAPLGEIRPPQNPPIQGHSLPKKVGRRSSKPILDWFQRNLEGQPGLAVRLMSHTLGCLTVTVADRREKNGGLDLLTGPEN